MIEFEPYGQYIGQRGGASSTEGWIWGWNLGEGVCRRACKGVAEDALGLYQVQFLSPDHRLGPALYAELAIDMIDV